MRLSVLLLSITFLIVNCKNDDLPSRCDKPISLYLINEAPAKLYVVSEDLFLSEELLTSIGQNDSIRIVTSILGDKEIRLFTSGNIGNPITEENAFVRLTKKITLTSCDQDIVRVKIDTSNIVYDVRDAIIGTYYCFYQRTNPDTSYQEEFPRSLLKAPNDLKKICWPFSSVCQTFEITDDIFRSNYSGPVRNLHYGRIDSLADTLIYLTNLSIYRCELL